jgi:zona occludens toxin (predicted ATPase)
LSAQPAKYWKHSAAAGTSIWRDSKIGLPLCSVSSRAISSAFSISFSPIFQTIRPRSRADSLLQGPSNAARAAATAASTSACSAEATSAIASSVAGLMTSIVFRPAASRHSPLMNSCFRITLVIGIKLIPSPIQHEGHEGHKGKILLFRSLRAFCG